MEFRPKLEQRGTCITKGELIKVRWCFYLKKQHLTQDPSIEQVVRQQSISNSTFYLR